jgi:hypothetical protein
MRLGRSPQIDFFGPWQHEGLAWLANRAQSWPADHHADCWQQFLPSSAINEGTECRDVRELTAALAQALQPSPYSVMKNASATTGNARPTHAASVHPPSAYAQPPSAEPTAQPMKKAAT